MPTTENPEVVSGREPGPQRRLDDVLKEAEASLVGISSSAEAARTSSVAALAAQRSAESASETAKRLWDEVTEFGAKIAASKANIADQQAVIATKSDHIQKAQEHADKVRANIDRALTSATQQVTLAEEQKAKATAANESAAKALAEARVAKGAIETDATAAAAARVVAEESSIKSKALADRSETIEARLKAYETRLAELETQAKAQLKTIESLLPLATSAGLASAFDSRRQTFLKPQNLWQGLFVSSVVVIVVLAYSGMSHILKAQTSITFHEIGLLWLARLPVVGALVWLAMHASTQAALAKRLEEDYGYKAAIASCFEGFKKQVSDVGKTIDPSSPLAQLLRNTLGTIATPPGRIYERHNPVVSPTQEVGDVVKLAAEAANPLKTTA